MRPQIRRNVSQRQPGAEQRTSRSDGLGAAHASPASAFLAPSMASKSSLPIVRAMSAEFSHSSASTAAPQTSAMRRPFDAVQGVVDPLAYALGKGLVNTGLGKSLVHTGFARERRGDRRFLLGVWLVLIVVVHAFVVSAVEHRAKLCDDSHSGSAISSATAGSCLRRRTA